MTLLNMLPGTSIDNQANQRLVNTILGGEVDVSHTSCGIPCANITHSTLGQFCVDVGFAAMNVVAKCVDATLHRAINHIVSLRPFEKVSRVTAWRVVAGMQTIWCGPSSMCQEESNPVRTKVLAIDPNVSVSLSTPGEAIPLPLPTGIRSTRTINPCPKSFLKRLVAMSSVSVEIAKGLALDMPTTGVGVEGNRRRLPATALAQTKRDGIVGLHCYVTSYIGQMGCRAGSDVSRCPAFVLPNYRRITGILPQLKALLRTFGLMAT